MLLAINEAKLAAKAGEVPVGAVLIDELNQQLISAGQNRRERDADPTAHAEVVAIRAAAAARKSWRLEGLTLYITLEPCPMCAGAIVNSRLNRIVFGATDPKAGAAGTLMNLCADPRLNHRASVTGGVLADECGSLLTHFFAARRAEGKK
jgi:tRNA(adenine34) deaminase